MAWARDDNVGFMDRWNPLSSKIPHTIFASHILIRRNKVKNRPELDIEGVVPELERAVQEYQRAHGRVSDFVDSDTAHFSLLCESNEDAVINLTWLKFNFN